MTRKSLNIHPNETRSERFRRIGNPRINTTLDSIRKLTNLSAPCYEYTEDQIETIVNSLRTATNNLESTLRKRFQAKGPRVTL